jgi:hypothetical protein
MTWRYLCGDNLFAFSVTDGTILYSGYLALVCPRPEVEDVFSITNSLWQLSGVECHNMVSGIYGYWVVSSPFQTNMTWNTGGYMLLFVLIHGLCQIYSSASIMLQFTGGIHCHLRYSTYSCCAFFSCISNGILVDAWAFYSSGVCGKLNSYRSWFSLLFYNIKLSGRFEIRKKRLALYFERYGLS